MYDDNSRLTILLVAAVVVVVIVGAKARSDSERAVGIRSEDRTRTDGGRRRDLRHACWVYDRCGVDGRHPNANLVLLEEIGDQLVEVDIRFGIVKVGELVIITEVR